MESDDLMFQFRWLMFQAVVAMLTLYWISTWSDLKDLGLAPGIVSMFVAFLATGLLVRFLDLGAARRIVEVEQPVSRPQRLARICRIFGNRPKQISGSRISENIRKLP